MTPLIEAQNVTKVFGQGKRRTVALDDFSLTIQDDKPAFITVAGESGSGKTTLARLLLGFLSPSSGQILYKGKNIDAMAAEEGRVFRKEVQAIFQDPFAVYNPFYKVDHIMDAAINHFKLAKSKSEARNLMESALVGVGLRPEETLGRYPHQLSGGQRQRVTIARTLLLQPRLIIADEPVSMVDASLRATILESLFKLYRDFNISFIYITHDLTTAYQISQNIIILYKGYVSEAGDTEQIITNPQHPYTQELVKSIPWPDPDRRWGEDHEAQEGSGSTAAAGKGCPYSNRCPYVMDICRESPPPLYQTAEHRVVTCYLYKESPVMAGTDVAQVFSARTESSGIPVMTNGKGGEAAN